ncbi:MAG: hypothetical protein M3O70_09205 [Actinomycetota bacterium]|nr:hypothetical protein [Actinomycetota bacterium]
MTPAQAKKLALLSVVLSAATSYIRQATDPVQDASLSRTVMGGIVVGMILTGTADFAPELAGPFSVLILVVALSYSAPELLKMVDKAGK